MHLIPLTLTQWQHERRWEATERAATVRFTFGGKIALFFSGDHILYIRSYEEQSREART